MDICVSAQFGELLPPRILKQIQDLRVGVRGILPNGARHQEVERLVGQIARDIAYPSIFLVAVWDWFDAATGRHWQDREAKPSPQHVADLTRSFLAVVESQGALDQFRLDVGTEINIDPVFKKDMGLLREQCEAARAVMREKYGARAPRVIAASVSNIHRDDGMKHLKKWCREIDEDFDISIHPYRTTDPPDVFRGYRDEGEMFRALKDIIGPRRFHVTECGWHDWEQTYHVGPWGSIEKRSQFTPEQVAAFTKDDLERWERLGALSYTIYQIQDGPKGGPGWDVYEAHFGLYSAEGDAKPVAKWLKARA